MHVPGQGMLKGLRCLDSDLQGGVGAGFSVFKSVFGSLLAFEGSKTYLWLVGNGRMVVIVVIIVPHSSIPY